MITKHTGGTAFPYGEKNITLRHSEGMTLRDYFAAKAMQAIFSRNAYSITQVAGEAYDIADAMLRERQK